MPRHAEPITEVLDERECLRLVAPGGVGRIAFVGELDLTVPAGQLPADRRDHSVPYQGGRPDRRPGRGRPSVGGRDLETTDFGKLARTVLSDAITSALGADPAMPVTEVVREGPPPRVLLDAADGADPLVVGSRGYGGFTEALLGSVSQHVVHHAECPVVVIRDVA